MKKVGFFGGCFNPPTNVHIELANNLIKDNILDKVIFVPVGDYYQKQSLISALHRYNMLKIACKNYENLEVENIASMHTDKLYATDTFELIYNKYNKNVDMYLIMGSDNFVKMPQWKNYEEIKDKYNFIVIERFKYETPCRQKNVIYYQTKQTEDMSATRIRHKLEKGEDVSDYINSEVLKYIEKNKLYKIKR